jgi:small subunit ribosomal protein S8e
VRVIVVAFHPSNNEFIRTNTLTKSAVVQIDATPFRQWYEAHYGTSIGRRKQKAGQEVVEDKKVSKSVQGKREERVKKVGKIEAALYAVVSSRPGQSGRVDGYVLEGDELAFYQKAIRK